MLCVKCGTQLPDASAFCNKCGASQAVPASPGAPPAPPSPPAPSGRDDAPEEIVWSGRYSAKAGGHWWLLWLLWLIGLAYLRLGVVNPSPEKAKYFNYGLLILLAVPALAIVWDTLYRKLTLRYKLSTHRFFKESGFISRHVNELELIRVDDVSVRQNIIQRIFNVGVVTIISTDATDPRLNVDGIDNPIEIKEKIRGHARDRRKRAIHMESL
jgi:membrane protein YdbS with pleckstrin-like domain